MQITNIYSFAELVMSPFLLIALFSNLCGSCSNLVAYKYTVARSLSGRQAIVIENQLVLCSVPKCGITVFLESITYTL